MKVDITEDRRYTGNLAAAGETVSGPRPVRVVTVSYLIPFSLRESIEHRLEHRKQIEYPFAFGSANRFNRQCAEWHIIFLSMWPAARDLSAVRSACGPPPFFVTVNLVSLVFRDCCQYSRINPLVHSLPQGAARLFRCMSDSGPPHDIVPFSTTALACLHLATFTGFLFTATVR